MPGGEAVTGFGDDQAKPFDAFEVFGDRGEFALSNAAFELVGDLFGGSVARRVRSRSRQLLRC